MPALHCHCTTAVQLSVGDRLVCGTCGQCRGCQAEVSPILVFSLLLDQVEGEAIQLPTGLYHPACLNCAECRTNLAGLPAYPPTCEICSVSPGRGVALDSAKQPHCPRACGRPVPRCAGCGDQVVPGPGSTRVTRLRALNKDWHPTCFTCRVLHNPTPHRTELTMCRVAARRWTPM